MKTDKITVTSWGRKMEEALNQADKVGVYKGLSAKSVLQLRLLTEEMMGMMRSLTGEKEGTFWIEDENGVYSLHLQVLTRMNSEKRDQLLAVSTSGANESAKGLMGRLRDFFDRNADEDVASYASPLLLPSMYEQSTTSTLDWEWSMTRYQNALTQLRASDKSAQEAWDELEKSVVAHVADDVKVSIRGGQVEMTIIKKLA
jgi:hypothetical protein